MNEPTNLTAILCMVIASIFATSTYAPVKAQKLSAPKKPRAQEAASKLRTMFFARDYEGGSREGKKLTAQFPAALELRAWYVLHMAADRQEKEAIEAAEKMTVSHPDSAWSWFALARALNSSSERSREALGASEKALAKLPTHPDFIWLRAAVLRQQDKVEEAVALIDEHLPKAKHPAELLVSKGGALYSLGSGRKRDESKVAAAFSTFEEARKVDPSNVNAHYIPGNYLVGMRRAAEGYPLLKKAVALAPNSVWIHYDYWRAITGMADWPTEKKQSEIEASINSLLARRGDYPGTLLQVAGQYGDLKLKNKRLEFEDRILQQHGTSKEAEWVLVNRYRDFATEAGPEGLKDPKQKEAFRRMLRDFINRPHHHRETLIGDAYRSLFFTIDKNDATIGDAELLEIVNGLIKYEGINVTLTFPGGAIALAERKVYFREAEAIARAGITEAKKKIDQQRKFYDTEGDYVQALNRANGIMKDAIGWVFFNEGRLDEAEKELLKAYEVAQENRLNLYHLGQLYQSKKDLEKGEEYYIKGMLVQGMGENPSAKALKDLYALRRGNLDGYEEYLGKLKEIDAAKRKQKVLAARIAQPLLVTPFHLKTLSGEFATFDSLKGRILVINFWGTWCGPCVQEMPDIQKLHEKYSRDPEVVVLTIDNDADVSDPRQFMEKHKYSFKVLLDDGYVDKVSLHVFPTTWFVDKDGRIAFVKVGWSERLVEEFSWRVDEMRRSEMK